MKPEQPRANKYLQLKPEDLAKVQSKRRQIDNSSIKVEPEMLLICELGKHYGWSAIEAVLGKEIMYNDDGELMPDIMMQLIAGGRKVDAKNQYHQAQSSLIGSATANSKKPGKTFNELTKQIVKNMKAD